MKKLLVYYIALTVALTSPVWALPTLQLDILGGTYDPSTETIVATSSPFTLRALLDPGTADSNIVGYFISAAIIPTTTDTTGATFGSFSIDGVTYGSGGSGTLQYGTPPVDAAFPDLGPHSIFPTVYAEVGFSFNPANTVAAYNTQTGSPEGSGTLQYVDFNIDVSNLASGYYLHFDLYDEYLKTSGSKPNQTNFAPFSHDAESGHSVPDGGATVMLLGAALVGLGAARRFMMAKPALSSD